MSGDRAATGEPSRKPTPAGYAIGAVFLLFIIGGIFLALRSGDDAAGSAHIVSGSGSSNGLTPDDREGTPYPGPGESDLTTAARAAGCVVRLDLKDEGNDHLEPGTQPPAYGTVPPTSGDHISPPLQQADGAWADPAEPINVVHSLEHGRIAIQYNPALPESAQLELKGFYDTIYSGALLFPNPDMPYAVAATAWRNLIGCPRWQGQQTLDAVRAFGIANFDRAPEPMGWFESLNGPSFAEPAV